VSQLTDTLGTFKVGIFANKTVKYCANLYRVRIKIYYSNNFCSSYNKKTEITNSIKERKDFMISQLQCTQLKDPQLRDTVLFYFY